MYCPNCRRLNPQDAQSCQYCGATLAIPPEAARFIAAQVAARRLNKRRKTAFGKLMDNFIVPVLKGVLWMMMEIFKALPRLIQTIFEGISRI